MTAEALDTRAGVVSIRTTRGTFTVGPHGQISRGLWRIVGRELRTNEQVRAMCSGARERRHSAGDKPVGRAALIRWRKTENFPAPVLTLELRGQAVELWAQSDVEAWLGDRARKAS